jgi:hypothetical protein
MPTDSLPPDMAPTGAGWTSNTTAVASDTTLAWSTALCHAGRSRKGDVPQTLDEHARSGLMDGIEGITIRSRWIVAIEINFHVGKD